MAVGRLENVLLEIDAYNRKDPHGREFMYSDRLTQWVFTLNPAPSEALRIAARGQHIGRWKSPRDAYPMDRAGYLRWREDLKRFHADTVGQIMAKEGYAEYEIEAVRQIILKKNYKTNSDAQTIEDALCLVFLETQFEALKEKTPDAKMSDILKKTWNKMSEAGKKAALALNQDEVKRLLQLTLPG
jgi:hypothetical protein